MVYHHPVHETREKAEAPGALREDLTSPSLRKDARGKVPAACSASERG